MDEVKRRDAHAFFVRYTKFQTIDERKAILAEAGRVRMAQWAGIRRKTLLSLAQGRDRWRSPMRPCAARFGLLRELVVGPSSRRPRRGVSGNVAVVQRGP